MKFGSVCSGIEAASVAWHPLGWKAAWLAEIEPFPAAVLAHHYPDVPNIGDMTKLLELIPSGGVEAPDVFCGGTPCQAFSVAGLRKSLDDARGNLSLIFCEIANAIDNVRADRGEPPAIIFWENVPGVLSTKDNAFGCFLAGLAGEDGELVAPGGKWANAGAVYGPKRAVAWRVLDAQYFGVAQRRRRVFVVASARTGFDPVSVLFEFEGVRRDIAPSRQAGEGTAGSAARSVGGGGLGTDFDCDGGVMPASYALQGNMIGRHDLAGPAGSGISAELCFTQTKMDAHAVVTHSLRGEGFDASEDGTGRGTPLVPVGGVKYAHYSHDYAHDRITDPVGVNPALTKEAHASGNLNVAVAVALRGRDGGATAELGDEVQNCLRASQGGGDKPHVLAPVAFTTEQTPKFNHDQALTLTKQSPTGGGQVQSVMQHMQVRRLTPVECERLQGFPDNYTNIPWSAAKEAARKGISYEAILTLRGMTLRGPNLEDCPDGPRYKALGNSWAVPVVRWIGARIQEAVMHPANDNSQRKEAAA